MPRLFLDVTVRHGVPGCQHRVAQAANHSGSVNSEAEFDKQVRYPARRSPWRMVPLALETYGRLGRQNLRHLRSLARTQAARLDEDSAAAAGVLLQRWSRRISVALHRANYRNLRSSLGVAAMSAQLQRQLADSLAA